MKKRNIILHITAFVFMICVCTEVFSQGYRRNSGGSFFKCFDIGFTGGLEQYRGDYHAFRSALRDLDYNLGYGFNLRYNFNGEYMSGTLQSILDRRLSISLGTRKMKATSNKKDEGDVMSMDILEFSAMLQCNILKYSSMKNINDGGQPFSPYVELGIGYTGFKCDNLMDYNYEMNGGYIDEDYIFRPVVIAGWGVKVCLLQGVTVGLNGSYRFVFTDEIDHLIDRSERNDQYYYVGAELFFNLGEIFSRR